LDNPEGLNQIADPQVWRTRLANDISCHSLSFSSSFSIPTARA
jgi:hypothetical protein